MTRRALILMLLAPLLLDQAEARGDRGGRGSGGRRGYRGGRSGGGRSFRGVAGGIGAPLTIAALVSSVIWFSKRSSKPRSLNWHRSSGSPVRHDVTAPIYDVTIIDVTDRHKIGPGGGASVSTVMSPRNASPMYFRIRACTSFSSSPDRILKICTSNRLFPDCGTKC